MTSQKNFEKIACQIGVKTHFNEKKSLICHCNIDSWKQKLSFRYVRVPKINYNIIYQIRGVILVKIEKFMPENA
jgi:hypothetical protein